jgi:hypothetical protein
MGPGDGRERRTEIEIVIKLNPKDEDNMRRWLDGLMK